MTDDTERRLRDSLRGATLPDAPASLRDALHAVAASPAPVAPRRTWLRTLPAMAAVVVLAVVAASMTGGVGLLGGGGADASSSAVASRTLSSAAPSAEPSMLNTSPIPPASSGPLLPSPTNRSQVYPAADLAAALKADRQAWLGKAVLVEGRVFLADRLMCQIVSAGCAIGTLVGTTETVEASGYTSSLMAWSDVETADRFAMLVRPDGLELLGVLGNATSQDFQTDPAGIARAMPQDTVLQVFEVQGWLGTSGPLPCPSVPGSPPPSDTPFGSACPVAWLADTDSRAPMESVRVQYGAYDTYAGSSAGSPTPVHGHYLVRLVLDTRTLGPSAPRGWQVVGRTDDASAIAPSQSAPAASALKVWTPDELTSALDHNRASLVNTPVIVAGSVTREPVSDSCDVVVPTLGQASSLCTFGQLDGTPEAVWATPYTLQLRANASPIVGRLVLRVLPAGLEFLGLAGGDANGTGFKASLDDLRQPWSTDKVLTVLVVHAWIVATPPLRCGPATIPAAPVDSPFGNCNRAWLNAASEQPTTLTADGMSVVAPPDGVVVQWSAYANFAPDPSTAYPPDPREGTYLVRLVQDTRDGTNGALGWQVVARVSP